MMPRLSLTFAAAVTASTLLRFWLSSRQVAAVASGSGRVPQPFADRISLPEHQKAAQYSLENLRLGRIGFVIDAAVTLGLTMGGGIAALESVWAQSGWPQPWRGVAVIFSAVVFISLLDLPLSVWRTFVLEARFGFNRTTPWLFVSDLAKSALVGLLIGIPVCVGALLLMTLAGPLWWFWVWCGWLALMLLMTWAWPAFIAPLFNRFTPLGDLILRTRLESLLHRTGFTLQGIFVVDGSRRSAHGNAYFTGIGRHKRIVFYDTLLSRLTHDEVEAVLAHELGHFKLRHVRKRLLLTVATSFAALALLGWGSGRQDFYAALGVPQMSPEAALLLFMLAAPVFLFFLTPLGSFWSRRHEFEADGFAARTSSAPELATALVKLYRDNATTLTPDAVYSAFYYSHPPALERIARLREIVVATDAAASAV
jgi:STE24 endopeptidase